MLIRATKWHIPIIVGFFSRWSDLKFPYKLCEFSEFFFKLFECFLLILNSKQRISRAELIRAHKESTSKKASKYCFSIIDIPQKLLIRSCYQAKTNILYTEDPTSSQAACVFLFEIIDVGENFDCFWIIDDSSR